MSKDATVNRTIRAAMERQGMDCEGLARRSGVSAARLALATRGLGSLMADEFVRVCAALGLSLKDFSEEKAGGGVCTEAIGVASHAIPNAMAAPPAASLSRLAEEVLDGLKPRKQDGTLTKH